MTGELVKVCRLCWRDRHEICVGIGCAYTATPRCARNARLEQERRTPEDAA